MSKPRIAIPITVQFSIRYVLRTGLLERIKAYAEPIILLRWHDSELEAELRDLGIEYHMLPATSYRVGYTRIKQQIDLWHLNQLGSPTTAIDKRRIHQLTPPTARSRVRDTLYRLNLALPGRAEHLKRRFQTATEHHSNIATFRELLQTIRADAVFSLTPYFQHEQLLLIAARQMKLGLATSIISFDNITTRGWIPVQFDHYLLWNHYNKAELLRAYPEASSSTIVIVGAPQFDFYWNKTFIWDETLWRHRLGIPEGRPVILFGAGHYLIVPHEPHWLAQLDAAIESGEIPGRPIILFRRHPNDPLDRWLPALNAAKHTVRDDPWVISDTDPALTNIRRSDIERLASTLAHCSVHINASSTMTIDGAIFDRPQIGPAYDDRHGRPFHRITQELYVREHYLPITRSGGLRIVHSREELIAAVRAGLKDPESERVGRERLIKEICTFNDGNSTQRVDQALQEFPEYCPTSD